MIQGLYRKYIPLFPYKPPVGVCMPLRLCFFGLALGFLLGFIWAIFRQGCLKRTLAATVDVVPERGVWQKLAALGVKFRAIFAICD